MHAAQLYEVLDATWPPASQTRQGTIVVRDGAGGGKRVSSAYVPTETFDSADIEGVNLFQIREGQDELDTKLAERGFEIVDPTLIYTRSLDLSDLYDIPPTTAFEIWPPLQLMRDIWSVGGIDAQRLAVMDRVEGPKTGLFGRINDHAGGAGFVAVHNGVAMLHALEVLSDARGHGLGRYMSQTAMNWGAENGAKLFALAVTDANDVAKKLYTSLGMSLSARYHYRIKR